MDGRRIPRTARKTQQWDGVYCHLLRDLSSVRLHWQLRLIDASVSGCCGTRAYLTPQFKGVGSHVRQRWQGSTFWILGSLPFSLCHLGTGAEDHFAGISDLLSAGLNVAWRLGGCMLWVWVAQEKSGICFSGVCPSVAVQVIGWHLPAALSYNSGRSVHFNKLRVVVDCQQEGFWIKIEEDCVQQHHHLIALHFRLQVSVTCHPK